MNFIFDQVKEALLRAQNILIISHQKADGDSCGSSLSMVHYLQSLGKNVAVYCDGGVPKNLNFLPGTQNVSGDRNILKKYWDTVMFLDCGDLSHAKVVIEDLNKAFVINIDHHISNCKYGNINFVDSKASSTCEIVNKYFLSIGYNIDKKISTCLLTGILTDTQAFTNGATNLCSIEMASQLIKKGSRIGLSVDNYFKNKTINSLKLWGEILSRLRINKKYSIAYTYIADDDLKRFQVKPEELDGVINFMNLLAGVKACLVIKQEGLQTKVSTRTNSNEIDLAVFAKLFNGGGHKKAAGFTVNYPVTIDNDKLTISC